MSINGEQILEYIPEPAIVIDLEDKVVAANELFLTQYGVKRRALGQSLAIGNLIQFQNIDSLKAQTETFQETKFTIVPTNLTGTCLLGTRRIGDQIILVLKDTSVEVELHSKYQKQLDELAEYSKSLEEKVRLRTKELSEANQFISGMLDSLNQAILVLNAEGKCLPFHTSNCATVFKTNPEGKYFWDIIAAPVEEQTFLRRWITHLIKEKINFDDIAELGPQLVIKDSSHLELKYFPLRSDKFTAEGVVVVARDITRLVELEADLHTTEEFEKILTKAATNLFIYRSAKEEHEHILKTLVQATNIDELMFKKVLHQLKGSFSLFSMKSLEKLTHEIEDFTSTSLIEWKTKFTELAEATQAMHTRLSMSLSLPPSGRQIWIDQQKIISLAQKVEQPMREELMALTTMKLKDYLQSFAAYGLDLCNQLGKKMHQFNIQGPELPAYPSLIRTLQPILTLYLRNVVDHGFWEEDEGQNSIKIDYNLTDKHLILSITDSGRGAKAPKLQTPNLISGRGLGMQIIQDLINELNGAHKQVFTDKGCILTLEMDWPAEENKSWAN